MVLLSHLFNKHLNDSANVAITQFSQLRDEGHCKETILHPVLLQLYSLHTTHPVVGIFKRVTRFPWRERAEILSDFIPNLLKTEKSFCQDNFGKYLPAVFWLARLHLDFAGLIYLFSMLGEVETFVAVDNLAYFEDLERHLKDESETD